MIQQNDRAAWLAERSTAIGASEIACLYRDPQTGASLGFVSEYRLWAIKSGLVPSNDDDYRTDDEIESLYWGNKLQAAIIEGIRERLNIEIVEAPQDVFIRHPDYPFIGCTPDAYAMCSERGEGLGEIKNINQFLTNDWNDAPPLRVQIQTQAQMLVTGRKWNLAAGLVGGNRLKSHMVERHEGFIADMLRRATEFWRRVTDNDPPPVDGSASTARTIRQLHPNDNGRTTLMEDEFDNLLVELHGLKERRSSSEKRIDELENTIKARIGKCTFAGFPGGWWASYATQHSPGYYREPSDYRVLRFHKRKPEGCGGPAEDADESPLILPHGVEFNGTMPEATPRKKSYAEARNYLFDLHPHCTFCGCKLTRAKATLDHRVPLCLGGPNDESNYCLACKDCNQTKGGSAIDPDCKLTKASKKKESV